MNWFRRRTDRGKHDIYRHNPYEFIYTHNSYEFAESFTYLTCAIDRTTSFVPATPDRSRTGQNSIVIILQLPGKRGSRRHGERGRNRHTLGRWGRTGGGGAGVDRRRDWLGDLLVPFVGAVVRIAGWEVGGYLWRLVTGRGGEGIPCRDAPFFRVGVATLTWRNCGRAPRNKIPAS